MDLYFCVKYLREGKDSKCLEMMFKQELFLKVTPAPDLHVSRCAKLFLNYSM